MSDIVIIDVEQRTLPWFQARAGVISASNFHLLRESAKLKTGKNRGDYNGKAKALAFKLAIERISGLPLEVDDGFEVWQAKRGNVLEPYAKLRHERKCDILVETAGFIKTSDGKFGASADGFTDRAGLRRGCEYKCFLNPEKLSDILLFGSTDEVIDQCDGGMWLTNLPAWDFGLYCPALDVIGLDFTLIPIQRNEARIEALEADLVAFDHLVEDCVTRLRQRAGLNYTPPWTDAEPVEAAIAINRELSAVAPTLAPRPAAPRAAPAAVALPDFF